MHRSKWLGFRHSGAMIGVAALMVACDQGPTYPGAEPAPARIAPSVETDPAIVELRRATARYHDLAHALEDGFVFLHACSNEPGEGPVGTVYVHIEHVLDGVIDPGKPDALIYRPLDDGTLELTGAELAVPDTGQAAPQFLGATFQREPEFGVFGLHVWIWLPNPDGLFAELNPRVTCGAE